MITYVHIVVNHFVASCPTSEINTTTALILIKLGYWINKATKSQMLTPLIVALTFYTGNNKKLWFVPHT